MDLKMWNYIEDAKPSLLAYVWLSPTSYLPRLVNIVKEWPPKSWAGVAGWISKCEITLKMQSLHCWHRHGLRPKWFIKSWTSKEPAHSCARPSLNYCYYIELPNTVVENLSHLCRFRLSYFLLQFCTSYYKVLILLQVKKFYTNFEWTTKKYSSMTFQFHIY